MHLTQKQQARKMDTASERRCCPANERRIERLAASDICNWRNVGVEVVDNLRLPLRVTAAMRRLSWQTKDFSGETIAT